MFLQIHCRFLCLFALVFFLNVSLSFSSIVDEMNVSLLWAIQPKRLDTDCNDSNHAEQWRNNKEKKIRTTCHKHVLRCWFEKEKKNMVEDMRYIAERQIFMNSYFVMAATDKKKLPLRISSGAIQKKWWSEPVAKFQFGSPWLSV